MNADSSSTQELSAGPTALTALVRAKDWSLTPLGPVHRWPETLRVAVDICLHSRFPMFIWWGPDLINIYNDAYALMLGKRHPAALGESAREIWKEIWSIVGPQTQIVFEQDKATWNDRVKLVLERNGYPEEAYFTFSYSPIHEGNRVAGLFCAVSEETQRILDEAARSRLAAIVESSDDAIISKTLDGIIRSWNAGAQRIFGYTADEAIGKSILMLLPEDRKSEEAGILARLRRGERIQHYESVRVTKHGNLIDVSLTISPVKDESGRIIGASKVARDITEKRLSLIEKDRLLESERVARGEAERQGRLKDEFVSTLSHELRTPLNAIMGYAHILRRDPSLSPDALEGISVIERNARVQAQIVEDILDVSRIVSGKMRLDVQPVNLQAVIEAAMETCTPAADAKGIRLAKLLDPLAGPVSGDPARLQQCIWNLVSNSIKFSSRGGRVQVVLQRVNSHIEIVVSDTGQGIKPQFLPYVFDRFRQEDASTTRHASGLGLGLSIVKSLVEMHGGTIAARSEGENQGATFTISLPLSLAHPPDTDEQRHHPRTPREPISHFQPLSLKGLTVLAVDDETDARDLMRRLLEECGASVFTAGSAREALAVLDKHPVNLLISDIGMPGEDGYELVRKIRRRPPETGGKVPAIALTAYARSEDRTRAMLAGFVGHVSKPVEPAELIATVASLATRD